MALPDISNRLSEKYEKQDRLEIIRDLKRGRYQEALDLLGRYQNHKLPRTEDGVSRITEYFFLIHSAYSYFRLHRISEAKECLVKVLKTRPLDGAANLFLAYIELLEGNKPRSIQIYAVLLENPFYLPRAYKLLEALRYSDSLESLLLIKPMRFFYRHDLPNIFWEDCWEALLTIQRGLSKITEIGFKFLKRDFQSNNKGRGNTFTIGNINLSGISGLRLTLSLIMLMGIGVFIFFYLDGGGKLLSWGNRVSRSFGGSLSGIEGIFSPNLLSQYGEEAILSWENQYQEMKENINLRQFNTALRIYNTINSEADLPIEVKNKFYILSTFISHPQFDEIPSLSAYSSIPSHDIDLAYGLYYRFGFKVLKSSQDDTRYLVDLLDFKPSVSVQNDYSPRRAILIWDKNSVGNVEVGERFQVGEGYETIAQLQSHDQKYLIFKARVIRNPVNLTRE